MTVARPRLRLFAAGPIGGPVASYKFNYKFQCTSFGGPFGDGAAAPERVIQHETNTQTAKAAHVLYHPREVTMSLDTGGTRAHASLSAVPDGQIRVMIHGTKDLDVAHIEESSLTFHGAKPLSVEVKDVDGDGTPDLVLRFRRADARLSPNAKYMSVRGWLKSSQAFSGTVDLAKGP